MIHLDKVDKNPNVAIVGAGPGGYTAAIRLGQLGMNPVVIEQEKVGGVCLNWGCIPTKTIYSTTEPLAKLSSWKNRGIEFNPPQISLSDITSHQSKVANKLTDGVEKLIKSNKGTILYGKAEVTTGPKVIVKKDGEEVILEPDTLIIASGSVPIELPGFPFSQAGIWDSKTAVMPPEIPDRLVILGAGVIGLEMGTIYNRLGSKINIIEMQDSILPTLNLDRRIASYLNRSLEKSGIDIYTETRAKELRTVRDNKMVIGEKGGEEVSLPADRVLVAVGRRPHLDFFDDELGLEYDDDGFLETDESCLTNIEEVYAIGDIAGGPLLAHKASREALIASAQIAGQKVSNYKVVPSAVFTDPEYARVGMSESQARQNDYEPLIGRFPLRASGKAAAMDETTGTIKLVADKDTDRLLGGSILAPHASDMISELALAIEAGLTVTQIAETIHPHPTLSEAIMEAAENTHGGAIHTSNR